MSAGSWHKARLLEKRGSLQQDVAGPAMTITSAEAIAQHCLIAITLTGDSVGADSSANTAFQALMYWLSRPIRGGAAIR
jgi:hypothetical protein